MAIRAKTGLRLLTLLLLASMICTLVPAKAFTFAEASANLQFIGDGSKENPLAVTTVEELAAKYMLLRGFELGTVYYSTAQGSHFSAQSILDAFECLFPFMITILSSISDGIPYFSVEYLTPEYVQPAIAAAELAVKELITPDMGYLEKIRAIHDYIVVTVSYNHELNNGDYGIEHVGYTAYGALVEKSAVCEGYSSAFALMCHISGIPAYQIRGMVGRQLHKWNLVFLFGELFHVDPTFDDTDVSSYELINYDYFMIKDGEMPKLHIYDANKSRETILSFHNKSLGAAQILGELGLMRGTDLGYELDRNPTRAEAAVMVVRLMGMEKEALANTVSVSHPFSDVPAWAAPYVAFLYNNGQAEGITGSDFGAAHALRIEDYLTFMLRLLGFDDKNGDFSWRDSISAAESIGLIHMGEFARYTEIDRAVMAELSLRTLLTGTRGMDYLIYGLIGSGAIAPESAEAVWDYIF